MLKSRVAEDQDISLSKLGFIDTSFMIFYSAGLFITSYIGDTYNPKAILNVSLASVGLVIICISLMGYFYTVLTVVYSVLFSLNGLFQSAGWPMCIAIFSNWFGKRNRGFYLSFLNTSAGLGNICGAFFTSWSTQTMGLSWSMTYALVGGLCLLAFLFNQLFMISHPREKGIVVDELDEDQIKSENILSAQREREDQSP